MVNMMANTTTPKQRIRDALDKRLPADRVPHLEIEFQIYEEILGRNIISGSEFAKLTGKDKDLALRENARIMLEIARRTGQDAIKDISFYWEASPGHPAYLWLEKMEDRMQLIRYLKEYGEDQFFIMGTVGACLTIPDGNHFEEFSIALFEEPQKIHEQAQTLLDNALREQEQLCAAGTDGIICASDVAFNTGTFLSPKMMDEFFFPYFFKWVKATKELGTHSIWHTDGDITALLDRAVESGVDAVQCIDPLAGMDIIKLLDQYEGKLGMIGNLDCSLLQSGPEEEIKKETRRIVEGCKWKRGFIFSGCNAIFKGIPAANYEAMIEAKLACGNLINP